MRAFRAAGWAVPRGLARAESSVEHRDVVASVLAALWRDTAALISALFLVLLVVAAIFAPSIAPHDSLSQDLLNSLQPPVFAGGSTAHVLGTDHFGRDVLSRIIYGARVSLFIGFLAVFLSGFLGVLLGLIAGYYGGLVDDIVMRITEIQLAFPFLLLAIAVMAVLGSGIQNIIIVLGTFGWVIYSRTVRADVLSVKRKEYVEAARALGAGNRRIMWCHILPNVLAPVIVLASFAVAQMIVSEAALSFLGLGVRPPTPSWGGMLADGRDYLGVAWWIATFGGVAIMVTVLAVNLVGDWLRDTLDPRVQTEHSRRWVRSHKP